MLYRAGFLSRSIEKKLSESGIPYEIIGGVKFFQRMEVMDVIAYLKLIAIDDDASLKRIINVPRRRFGRVKIARLEALQEEKNASSENDYTYSLFEVLKDNLDDKTLKSSDAGDFVNLISAMRNIMFTSDISEMINSLMEESGYEEYIRELGDEERLNNLTEFKRFSNEYEKRFGESLTLTEFLQNIALQSEADEDENRDAVKLMTIHAAKGLEFPIVFIVGLSESIFPNPKSIELRKLEGLEEERRLCYVAITRAMDYLFLMESEGISEKGSVKRPSRFLQEIGEDNYKRIGIINKELITDVTSYERASQGGSAKKINIGDEIEHHIFGRGIVSGISDKNRSYVVRFDKLPQPRNISESYFKDKDERVECSESDMPEELPDGLPEEPLEEVFNHIHPITSEAEKSDNLWKRDDVPHSGWICTGITDLGKPIGICEMCGHQIIRYVHHMTHPQYRPLNVGCVCAGKMEGDIEGAQKRERDFKNRQQRKQSFMRKPWKRSSRGNLYMKIKGHLLVIYEVKNGAGWKYSLDHVFCEMLYPSRRAAVDAAFEAVERAT